MVERSLITKLYAFRDIFIGSEMTGFFKKIPTFSHPKYLLKNQCHKCNIIDEKSPYFCSLLFGTPELFWTWIMNMSREVTQMSWVQFSVFPTYLWLYGYLFLPAWVSNPKIHAAKFACKRLWGLNEAVRYECTQRSLDSS